MKLQDITSNTLRYYLPDEGTVVKYVWGIKHGLLHIYSTRCDSCIDHLTPFLNMSVYCVIAEVFSWLLERVGISSATLSSLVSPSNLLTQD